MNDLEKEEYIAYLTGRKSSNKRNFHKEFLKEIETFKTKNQRSPKVLLHMCCIVCGCWPLELFTSLGCEVTVMYSNSNIHPREEYDLRLNEIRRHLKERYNDSIRLIIADYDYDTYSSTVIRNRGNDPEGWKSCFACYSARMRECFAYAEENHYDFFTTTLTFSRQKDAQKINEIGLNLEKQFHHTRYLVSDFKKADGALRCDKICKEYNIYRQNYCGCTHSYHERNATQ